MRGCLLVVAMGLAVLVLLVFVGAPVLASAVVRQGVIAAGLDAADITVDVTSEPPTDLLALHADRVAIKASDATWQGIPVGTVALTLEDVDLGSRRAANVEGELTDLTISGDGAELPVQRITLSGPSTAVGATAIVDASAAATYILQRIHAATGIVPTDVHLSTPDRLTVTIGALTAQGRLAIRDDGSLALETGVPLLPSLVLAQAGDLPVRLTRVGVRDGSLVLDGTLDRALMP